MREVSAMVLSKRSVLGRSTYLYIVEPAPITLAVGAGGGVGLDFFSLVYLFSFLSPYLRGPLKHKQPTR